AAIAARVAAALVVVLVAAVGMTTALQITATTAVGALVAVQAPHQVPI
ncbi:MAG: hypothetical protein JKY27_01925, partial [Magnetovibrio sp.]|nr:hypothetical protein [Magnetovibrio sp.]